MPTLGSPGAFVSRVVSSSGISGSSRVPGLPSGFRRLMAWSTRAGSTGSSRLVGGHQLAEAPQQFSGDGQPQLDPLFLAHIRQRSLDLAAQVPGDPIRRLG